MRPYLQALASGAPADFEGTLAALGDVLPLLAELPGTPQEPEWHGEGDVAAHTDLVLREAHALAEQHDLRGETRLAFLLGAALHDIGKALTTRLAPDAAGRERVISPRHADRGRSYLAYRLPELQLPFPVIWTVLGLVGHHHDLGRTLDVGTPPAYRRLARQVDLRLLYLLEQADLRGRVAADRDAKLELVELFRLGAEESGVWGVTDPYAAWGAATDALTAGLPARYRALVRERGVLDYEAGRIQTPEEAVARAYDARGGFARLVVTCGPSGSGKSAWVAEHLPDHEVVSLDALREALAGRRADQGMNGRVLQEAKERLRAALRARRAVVWDATNTRRDFRAAPLQLGFDYGAHTTLAVFQPPLSTVFTRNPARVHAVPAHVVAAQVDHAEFPYLPEAHHTRIIDEYGREAPIRPPAVG